MSESTTNEQKEPSFFPKIKEIGDVLVGELATHGDWVVANIQTTSFWPDTSQKVRYRGEIIWILPIMNGYFPSVAMKVPAGKTRDECAAIIMRFLSTLSWVQRQGIIVDGIGGGNLPRPMGREMSRGFSISNEFDLSYFPEPTDERALLALALMREGRGLNHPAYSFLSYYRVTEVALPNGRLRGTWITEHIDLIEDHRAKEVIASLQGSGVTDVGKHLYEMNRQAIAHASEHPIIDPDDPAHARRLWSEIPIMMALAELAIEEVLGVERPTTVYRKHLYELAGFKEIFGPDIVARIIAGIPPEEGLLVDIPTMSVQIRQRDPYAPLARLTPIHVGQEGSVVHLVMQSPDRFARIGFVLDFANERLHFDEFEGLAPLDDGSADAAEAIAELRRFHKDYFGNGQLHIYNVETGALLSRKDAYIPVNMMLDVEGADREIASWKQLAAQRRARTSSVHNEVLQKSGRYFLSVAVAFQTLKPYVTSEGSQATEPPSV